MIKNKFLYIVDWIFPNFHPNLLIQCYFILWVNPYVQHHLIVTLSKQMSLLTYRSDLYVTDCWLPVDWLLTDLWQCQVVMFYNSTTQTWRRCVESMLADTIMVIERRYVIFRKWLLLWDPKSQVSVWISAPHSVGTETGCTDWDCVHLARIQVRASRHPPAHVQKKGYWKIKTNTTHLAKKTNT